MKAIKKRSVVFNGKKTSISLEDEFWTAFDLIATVTGTPKREMLTDLSKEHTNLSSAVRVAVLNYYVERAEMFEEITAAD